MQGLETVRAFRLQENFVARDQAMLEESNRAFWPIHCVNRCASALITKLTISIAKAEYISLES